MDRTAKASAALVIAIAVVAAGGVLLQSFGSADASGQDEPDVSLQSFFAEQQAAFSQAQKAAIQALCDSGEVFPESGLPVHWSASNGSGTGAVMVMRPEGTTLQDATDELCGR